MSNSLRLTVPGKRPIAVSVPTDSIVALSPAAGGGTEIRIPTRTFTVSETLDELLLLWLGANNGDQAP